MDPLYLSYPWAATPRKQVIHTDPAVQLLILEYGNWVLVDAALPFLYFWPDQQGSYSLENALRIAIDDTGWLTLSLPNGRFHGLYYRQHRLLLEPGFPLQQVVRHLRDHHVEIYLPLGLLEFMDLLLRYRSLVAG